MVSIIVPVYNVEQYIGECIESVLNQTYKNWELILVVDGATDNSLEVCNYCKDKDSRIKVIEKANGGVSSARNAGIRVAEGNYMMFLDGDDWIESDTLESMVGKIIENQVDACYCSSYLQESEVKKTAIPDLYKNTVITAKKAIELQLSFKFVAAPWLSLVRKIKVSDVFFNESVHSYEDWEYNFRQLQKLEGIYIFDKAFYNYRIVSGSASRSLLSERKLTCFKNVEEVKKYIDEGKISCIKDVETLNAFFLYQMLVALANGGYVKKPAVFLRKKAREILTKTLSSDNVSIRNKIYTLMAAIHPRLFCIAYKLKYRV